MATIKPFKAVRPAPAHAARVAALPYDVMNTEEARQMAADNPYSFLHVSRAEIDLAPTVNVHSKEVYKKAKQNFDKLIADGILSQDKDACLYIYRLEMNGRQQTGLVACSTVDDYFNNVIKKHELTRPEKEKDRIEHMLELQAHVGPIFLTYPQNTGIDTIIAAETKGKPVYHFKADDGVTHTVWVITNRNNINALTQLFKKEVPYTYIADGHHRTASAAKVGQKLAAKNSSHTGKEEYNQFLSVLFPHNQLSIMDYNRVVKDMKGLRADSFISKVEKNFYVRRKAYGKASQPHEIRMYLKGEGWFSLTPHDEILNTTDPIASLDVSLLQNYLLKPILGINDPRTDKRIDFVGGIRGYKELERRVDSGEMKVAFALYPVSVEQLIAIADAGEIMPPKSTWFEPKLRDGLFCHLF